MSPIEQKPILHGRDHCLGGADPIPCLPDMSQGDDMDRIILSHGPAAFWKLNESSGVIAFDSSGNDNDLEAVAPTYDPPTWGAAAGPPGDTSAHFDTSTSDTRLAGTLSDFTDDFTAGIWVNNLTGEDGELMGQGTAYHSDPGWCLMIPSDTFALLVNGNPTYANAPHDLDTWYFLACVRSSGTWTLYVNGLLQTDTDTTSPSSGYGGNTWIGNDAEPAHSTFLRDHLLSYAFIVDSVLSGDDLLAIYESGIYSGGLPAGYVWTSDGAGGASWQPPGGGGTIEVDY